MADKCHSVGCGGGVLMGFKFRHDTDIEVKVKRRETIVITRINGVVTNTTHIRRGETVTFHKPLIRYLEGDWYIDGS